MGKPVVALYDPNKETNIATDTSSYGLGGVLMQKQPNSTWRPITLMSRSLTPTESRCATIEKDALALTWACKRCNDYLEVSQSKLRQTTSGWLQLLPQHTLDQIRSRIQRFWMRLMCFHTTTLTHVPSKEHYTPDALSRYSQTTIVDKPQFLMKK